MSRRKYFFRGAIFFLLVLLFIPERLLAQHPLHNAVERPMQLKMAEKGLVIHSAIRPYDRLELKTLEKAGHTFSDHAGFLVDKFSKKHKESADSSEAGNFEIDVMPLLAFEPGYELEHSAHWIRNTYFGARISGRFGEKLEGNINYFNGNHIPLSFMDRFAREDRVLVGEGLAKKAGPSYAWENVTGALSYLPNDHFLLEAGRGKHFWGDGYRSLLLSDVANPFNYLKATARVWVFKYVILYGQFKDIRGAGSERSRFQDKFGTFHFLDIQLGKRLNIGLFESVIWQGADTLVETGFDYNYLNPVIFFRPVEFSSGSAHNSLIGVNWSYRFFDKSVFYGQLIIDEFLLSDFVARNGSWRNKHGFQLGMKKFFEGEEGSWMLQGEYSQVRPYTYAHSSSLQNYAHFNQPLAHPLGANFRELVGIVTHSRGHWLVEAKGVYSIVGQDAKGLNYGSDLFQPYISRIGDLDNAIGQGVKRTIAQGGVQLSHLLSSKLNLRAAVGGGLRITEGASDPNSIFFTFGLRTSLSNLYNDF